MIGTGMPSLSGMTAETLIGAHTGAHHFRQENGNATKSESLTGLLEDVLDLSQDRPGDGRQGRAVQYALAPGRGDSGGGDAGSIDGQMERAAGQMDRLLQLLQLPADAERNHSLGRGIQEARELLERIGRNIVAGNREGVLRGTGESEQFVKLVKGFRQIVTEVEALMADEDRIPPSLMRVIKDLTSESMRPRSRAHADELA